jgi:cytochrome c553
MRFAAGLVLLGVTSLAMTGAVGARQQPQLEIPEWAYNSTPTPEAQLPHHPAIDPNELLSIPGSTRKFKLDEVENGADWFPEDHPTMPDIVAKGREGVRPCGTCHMPNGKGRPSNGPVTGLPVAYFIQAVEDYKNDLRISADPKKTNIRQMIGFAKLLTPEETRAAAEYFGSMKWTKWIRVVESERVPKTYVEGFIHYRYPGNETVPIGMRVIEMPEDNHQTEPLRNPRSGFVAYAPPGSIKRGEDLVKTGGNGRTLQCGICHGADLRGLGNVPGIAGKSPTWLTRQMFDMQAGTRKGPGSALMKQAVEKLRNEDYVALAAYISSLEP